MIEVKVLKVASTKELSTLEFNSLLNLNKLKFLILNQQLLVGEGGIEGGEDLDYSVVNSLDLDSFNEQNLTPLITKIDSEKLNKLQISESKAFSSYLNHNLLPLILHSLYSLPSNWSYLLPLMSHSLPFPSSLYLPNQLRTKAKELIQSTHFEFWNLGGEVEKELEEERNRKRLLLDTGSEAWKARQDEERKSGKGLVKDRFGRGKIEESASKILSALSTQLSLSSTPYFFNSPSPTSIDIELFSILSLIFYLDLPESYLLDLIKKEGEGGYSNLVVYVESIRSTLSKVEINQTTTPTTSTLNQITSLLPSLSFSSLSTLFPSIPFLHSTPLQPKPKPQTPSQTSSELKAIKQFKERRLIFFGLVALGVISWSFGTGVISIGFAGSEDDEKREEEVDWEVVEHIR